jgi:hypothetical protein
MTMKSLLFSSIALLLSSLLSNAQRDGEVGLTSPDRTLEHRS